MEDVRFLYLQAKRCYQLAWQSFDLRVAQRRYDLRKIDFDIR
jgi:hypothetical protein